MARKMIMITAVAATLVSAIAPATAMAQDRFRGGGENYSQQDEHGGWSRDDRNDQHGNWRENQGYDRYPHGYAERGYRGDRGYQVAYRDNGRQDDYERAGYDRNYYGRPTYRYRWEHRHDRHHDDDD